MCQPEWQLPAAASGLIPAGRQGTAPGRAAAPRQQELTRIARRAPASPAGCTLEPCALAPALSGAAELAQLPSGRVGSVCTPAPGSTGAAAPLPAACSFSSSSSSSSRARSAASSAARAALMAGFSLRWRSHLQGMQAQPMLPKAGQLSPELPVLTQRRALSPLQHALGTAGQPKAPGLLAVEEPTRGRC